MEKNNYLKCVEWVLLEFSCFFWVLYLGCIILIFYVFWFNFFMFINFVRRYKVFYNFFFEFILLEFYVLYLFLNIIIICKVDIFKIRKICFKYKLWWYVFLFFECNEVLEWMVLDIVCLIFVILIVWLDFFWEI